MLLLTLIGRILTHVSGDQPWDFVSTNNCDLRNLLILEETPIPSGLKITIASLTLSSFRDLRGLTFFICMCYFSSKNPFIYVTKILSKLIPTNLETNIVFPTSTFCGCSITSVLAEIATTEADSDPTTIGTLIIFLVNIIIYYLFLVLMLKHCGFISSNRWQLVMFLEFNNSRQMKASGYLDVLRRGLIVMSEGRIPKDQESEEAASTATATGGQDILQSSITVNLGIWTQWSSCKGLQRTD